MNSREGGFHCASWYFYLLIDTVMLPKRSKSEGDSIQSCTRKVIHWWLLGLPYWFKAGFLSNFFGFLHTQYAKDNFTWGKVQPTWGQIESNIRKLRKTCKIQNVWITQKTGILKFYEFFKFSDVQINLRRKRLLCTSENKFSLGKPNASVILMAKTICNRRIKPDKENTSMWKKINCATESLASSVTAEANLLLNT